MTVIGLLLTVLYQLFDRLIVSGNDQQKRVVHDAKLLQEVCVRLDLPQEISHFKLLISAYLYRLVKVLEILILQQLQVSSHLAVYLFHGPTWQVHDHVVIVSR